MINNDVFSEKGLYHLKKSIELIVNRRSDRVNLRSKPRTELFLNFCELHNFDIKEIKPNIIETTVITYNEITSFFPQFFIKERQKLDKYKEHIKAEIQQSIISAKHELSKSPFSYTPRMRLIKRILKQNLTRQIKFNNGTIWNLEIESRKKYLSVINSLKTVLKLINEKKICYTDYFGTILKISSSDATSLRRYLSDMFGVNLILFNVFPLKPRRGKRRVIDFIIEISLPDDITDEIMSRLVQIEKRIKFLIIDAIKILYKPNSQSDYYDNLPKRFRQSCENKFIDIIENCDKSRLSYWQPKFRNNKETFVNLINSASFSDSVRVILNHELWLNYFNAFFCSINRGIVDKYRIILIKARNNAFHGNKYLGAPISDILEGLFIFRNFLK